MSIIVILHANNVNNKQQTTIALVKLKLTCIGFVCRAA